MSKDNVNLQKLVKAELVSMKSEELGYVLPDRLLYSKYNIYRDDPRIIGYGSLPPKFVPNPCVFGIEEIIINKPNTIIKPKQVTEYLTGETFDYVLKDECKIITNQKELDTFVINTKKLVKYSIPTIEELWQYIQKHNNISEYKEYLQSLKEYSKAIHKKKKEAEEHEEYVDTIRECIIKEGLEEFKNHPEAMNTCLKLVRELNINDLKNATTEELINKIHIINPTLSNDEYASICIILLKIQSREHNENKKIVY